MITLVVWVLGVGEITLCVGVCGCSGWRRLGEVCGVRPANKFASTLARSARYARAQTMRDRLERKKKNSQEAVTLTKTRSGDSRRRSSILYPHHRCQKLSFSTKGKERW